MISGGATALATKPPPLAGPSHPDGLLWLAEFRERAEAQFQTVAASTAGFDTAAVTDLLLTLELRCRLEEQLLFPSLHGERDGRYRDRAAFDPEEGDLVTLRDLAARVRRASPDQALQRTTLLALEAMAMLHFAAIDRLLARHTRLLDRKPLGRNVEGVLNVWEQELRRDAYASGPHRELESPPPS